MSADRLAFVIDEPFIPDVYGGGVADIHELARGLLEFGWGADVHCLRPSDPRLPSRIMRRLPFPYAPTRHHSDLGYPVHRRSALSMVRHARLPGRDADVVVLQGARIPQLAIRYARLGLQVVLRVVTTESVDEIVAYTRGHGELQSHLESGAVTIVANSRFVATLAEDKVGVPVAWTYPPIATPRRSLETSSRGDSILFVNPVRVKGVDKALNIARLLPDTKFIFQESWPLPQAERVTLLDQLAHLPNVELRASVPNLDAVFRETRLLLVPSLWEEAFGRVIIEANRFGIPVVASRAGGIPEAVGSGGLLVERDASPESWVNAIGTILSDQKTWVERAFSNADSPEFSLNQVMNSFVEILKGTSRIAANNPPART